MLKRVEVCKIVILSRLQTNVIDKIYLKYARRVSLAKATESVPDYMRGSNRGSGPLSGNFKF